MLNNVLFEFNEMVVLEASLTEFQFIAFTVARMSNKVIWQSLLSKLQKAILQTLFCKSLATAAMHNPTKKNFIT